jgi:hypothetical protein
VRCFEVLSVLSDFGVSGHGSGHGSSPEKANGAANSAGHISTFPLISDEEHLAGLERAEWELAEELENVLEWIVATAER